MRGGGRRYDQDLSLTFQGADGVRTLTRQVQRALRASWHGYLPPGSCHITPLPGDVAGSDGNQFGASSIAVVPTMRYPVDIRWHQDLVYNAVWSLLVQVKRWNAELVGRGAGNAHHRIERILMTGLGTGCGQVSAARCARQMVLAIRHFAEGVPEDAGWADVGSLIKEVNATVGL